MSDPPMIDIKQGATFQGRTSYIGVPFMAIGFALLIGAALHDPIWMIPAIPLFAIGLVIFMVRKGTLIDPATKRFQPYQDFILFKMGPWIPMDGIFALRVKRERESYSHNPGGMGIMMNRTSFWCFNVTLHGTGLVKTHFLKEFYEAGPALEMGKRVAQALNIALEDASAAPPPSTSRRR